VRRAIDNSLCFGGYVSSEQIAFAGVTVVVPIDDRPYGMRDFRIADPSGNELSFGETIARAGAAK
jgi:uncharacterized glyoxalase superfamily protein PhnB